MIILTNLFFKNGGGALVSYPHNYFEYYDI